MSSAGIAVSHFRVDQVLSPVRRERSQSLHYLEKSVLIYLTFPGSSVMPMRILESDSIASLKLRIQSCKGFAVKNQKLVFDGRELARNDRLVRDCGLSDGNVIHLVIRLSEFRLIIVNTACGKKFEFQVEQNRNVAYIKDQIAKKGGKDFANIKNQQLVYDGEELEDRLLVNHISNNNDSIINLSIRMSAKVRTMPFERNFKLSFDARRSEGKRADDLKIVTTEPFDKHAWIEPVIVNPMVKLSPMLKELINATGTGIKQGIKPVMSSEGSGGVYFMKEGSGRKNVAVFKPIDEEPMAENNPRGLPLSVDGEGLKRGTRVGEGALREVAAYILDHSASGFRSFLSDEPGFSGVPPTVMVQCLSGGSDSFETKDFKIGSLQKFVECSGSCEDIGPRAFPVEEVHKIAVLDLRLANADRHAGNILFCREGEAGKISLVPIDHGYCLPEHFEDCTFDWLFWPQARQPFDSRTLDYIKSLDAEKDLALLKFYGWEPSPNCSQTFRISTMLLKKGAERRLTPYDIGNILCRETINKKSKIEEMIFKAMDSVLPGSSEDAFMETISEVMDAYLDKLTQ